MARNFVISVEIVAARPHPAPVAAWEEHLQARQEYSKALRVWREAEYLVNLNTERTAAACHDTADHASETAHHVRRALARAAVGRINFEEELAELLEGRETYG